MFGVNRVLFSFYLSEFIADSTTGVS